MILKFLDDFNILKVTDTEIWNDILDLTDPKEDDNEVTIIVTENDQIIEGSRISLFCKPNIDPKDLIEICNILLTGEDIDFLSLESNKWIKNIRGEKFCLYLSDAINKICNISTKIILTDNKYYLENKEGD